MARVPARREPRSRAVQDLIAGVGREDRAQLRIGGGRVVGINRDEEEGSFPSIIGKDQGQAVRVTLGGGYDKRQE